MSHGAHLSPQGTPEFTWRALESVLSVKPLRAVVMNDGRAIRKIKDLPRQERQLLWSYSSNTGESDWFSAVWERSSANNSHLRHQNKVLVTALGKKMGFCSTPTWESVNMRKNKVTVTCSVQVTTWVRKRNNEMMQPNPKPWFYCKAIKIHLLEGKSWVHFWKQKTFFSLIEGYSPGIRNKKH